MMDILILLYLIGTIVGHSPEQIGAMFVQLLLISTWPMSSRPRGPEDLC